MASVWKSMVVLIVVAMAAATGRDGDQLPDCANQLIGGLSGCLDAVTNPTTKPSADCCKGVSDVEKNQMKCICVLFRSPSFTTSINGTRVVELFLLCKVLADLALCTTGGSSTPTAAKFPPSPSSSAAPAPTSVTIECRKGWKCHKAGYTVLLTGLTMALALSLMFIGFLVHKKRKLAQAALERVRKEREQIMSANSGGRSAKIFSGREMKKATNLFSKDRLLGQGGFGEVYKGFLEDGTPIAVKIAKVDNTKGKEQVLNEVSILLLVNHRSLVRLLGCCVELEQPVLVYEFIPNGTLYEHIHTDRYGFLSWHERLIIAHQTAEGLAYLHSAAMPPIYHRDVKSSNILLDDRCNAKVSDFGLSRLIDPDQTHLSTCVQGTLGYLDPEYYRNYQLTDKSDVYSFGVVLLELLTSKKVIDHGRDSTEVNLFVHVQHRVDDGKSMEVVDEKLQWGASPGSLETMKALLSLAMDCLEERRLDRPSMKEVAEEIRYLNMKEENVALSCGGDRVDPQEQAD